MKKEISGWGGVKTRSDARTGKGLDEGAVKGLMEGSAKGD